jgi:hypothetical protein
MQNKMEQQVHGISTCYREVPRYQGIRFSIIMPDTVHTTQAQANRSYKAQKTCSSILINHTQRQKGEPSGWDSTSRWISLGLVSPSPVKRANHKNWMKTIVNSSNFYGSTGLGVGVAVVRAMQEHVHGTIAVKHGHSDLLAPTGGRRKIWRFEAGRADIVRE